METRRTLARRARVLGAALLVSAGAVACGGTGPVGRAPVASVNGADITQQDVIDLADAQRTLIERNGELTIARLAEGTDQSGNTPESVRAAVDQQVAPFRGTGTETIGVVGASDQLTQLIRLEIFRDLLTREGGEVTEAHREQARTELTGEITAAGLGEDDLPQALEDHYVEYAAVQAALREQIPDDVGAGSGLSPEAYEEQLRAVFETDGASYAQLCINGFVTDDQPTADEAAGRLAQGEPVVDVAADLATDDPTAAETTAECIDQPAGTIAASFGDDAFTAEPGDVLGPIEGDGEWLVVRVEEVDRPTFEDVRDQIAQANPDTSAQDRDTARNQYLDSLLVEAVEAAEVDIDRRFGTWDPTAAVVVPPTDPGADPPDIEDLVDEGR